MRYNFFVLQEKIESGRGDSKVLRKKFSQNLPFDSIVGEVIRIGDSAPQFWKRIRLENLVSHIHLSVQNESNN